MSPSWIIMTCNGCSIVLCQSNSKWRHPVNLKVKMNYCEMIFFLSKTPSLQTNLSCNHHFLWLKVIFMQKWRFYVLNTSTNFYWTTKHASNYQREPMTRREAGQTQPELLWMYDLSTDFEPLYPQFNLLLICQMLPH